MEVGVGVIGFGLAGRVFHAPFVSAVPGLKLEAFVERKTDEAHKAYPATSTYRAVEELLGDASVSLVVVATPNETHYVLAKQALEAGKHVVVDKPFAETSAQAEELIALAKAKGLVVAPFHNRRWDGDFLTVRKVLAKGKLGRLVTFESHFDRFKPIPRDGTWKEAGHPANGMLMDLGPHLVDQALALFGMPKTVTASVRADRDGSAIEDAFDLRLSYDGLTVWCRATMLACEASPRFLLHGTAGSFRKYGLDPQEPAIVAGVRVPRMGEGEWLQEEEAAWGEVVYAPALAAPATLVRERVKTEVGDYREFYANVRDAVSGVGELVVTAEDAVGVLKVLEAARVSSGEGRSVEVGDSDCISAVGVAFGEQSPSPNWKAKPTSTELQLDHHFWNAISTDSAFQRWFLTNSKFAGRPLELQMNELWHQRWYRDPDTNKDSETDITLIFRDTKSGDLLSIHIENKTKHRKWEPGQAEGYRKRALNRMAKWKHADCEVALLAPKDYIERYSAEAGNFDFLVYYEDVSKYVPEFADV